MNFLIFWSFKDFFSYKNVEFKLFCNQTKRNKWKKSTKVPNTSRSFLLLTLNEFDEFVSLGSVTYGMVN